MVCYAGKQEKPFWFSSLGQMIQFGAIIFCRTFKNYFGQFVWIEEKKKSHYNSRVSLHEAPTKNHTVNGSYLRFLKLCQKRLFSPKGSALLGFSGIVSFFEFVFFANESSSSREFLSSQVL